jgi:hypothetical protein
MKNIGVLASIGTLVALSLASIPAAAQGGMVGQANFTFVSPPCSVGGDKVEIVGRETSPGMWDVRALLVNADPSLSCAFANPQTFVGAYSPAAPGCVGAGLHRVCFATALAAGPNSVSIEICNIAWWGGCRTSVGPGTVVLA